MKFTLTIVSAILAAVAMASPSVPRGDGDSVSDASYGDCLTAAGAKKVANNYASLIGQYTEAKAQNLLHSGFSETSDSINVLSKKPLGSVTFPTKAAFIAELNKFPVFPLSITSIEAYTCDTVVVRWTQTFGRTKPQPAAGISSLRMKKTKDGWKFYRIFTEFNSITYYQNMGGVCPVVAERASNNNIESTSTSRERGRFGHHLPQSPSASYLATHWPTLPMSPIATMPPLAVGLAVTFAVLMGFVLAITCMLYCRASGRAGDLNSHNLGFTPLTTIHEASDEEDEGEDDRRQRTARSPV
ncbi:uncharacterized protein B0I36DRAFT_365211 [Microdochium trichocladiopsis]|uniref:NTF2-like domain-containing protein n=1 Tax=Microdochium trichocladiopsis TaxID=1682393 RepID=A0A9P8Y2N6_9PEZI|nr:uncharacterized protein B0I36DRAFT_365211 [Microdochium trichocladiopsis]KAH7028097.1 hypothetical protein B0I36DRAFT_365211 [Microdochium trichocladiopsis]